MTGVSSPTKFILSSLVQCLLILLWLFWSGSLGLEMVPRALSAALLAGTFALVNFLLVGHGDLSAVRAYPLPFLIGVVLSLVIYLGIFHGRDRFVPVIALSLGIILVDCYALLIENFIRKH